jgi:transposase
MLTLPPSVRVFVARAATDMRRGFDGLSVLVAEVIRADPLSGFLFVFFNRRRDRVKVLWWSSSGYWLLYHRLEKGTFALQSLDFHRAESIEVAASELSLLLEGIDLSTAKRRVRYEDGRRSRISSLVH